jgi:hypothetical protein
MYYGAISSSGVCHLSRPYRVILWTAPILLLNWVLIAVLDPDPGRSVSETAAIGFFFGSLFAHTTLAAAWTAFGPAPLVWRLPLSLVWVFGLAIAIQVNLVLNGGPDEGAVLVGACLFGQWLLLQVPLWTIALAFGAHLRHSDHLQAGFDPRERQFGIRQLIIVLGVAAIVQTLPLLLAALMRRFAIPGVLVVLVLIGFATAYLEVPLLRLVSRGPGLQTRDFIAINTFTTSIMIIVLLAVRLNGYCLSRWRPASG